MLTKNKGIQSLKLERRGFIITTTYLVILYATTFPLILPERIPKKPIPWIPIIFWYTLTLILLKKSRPCREEETHEIMEIYTRKDLLKYMAVLLILTFIMCQAPPISYATTVTLLLSIIALAPIIFIKTLIS